MSWYNFLKEIPILNGVYKKCWNLLGDVLYHLIEWFVPKLKNPVSISAFLRVFAKLYFYVATSRLVTMQTPWQSTIFVFICKHILDSVFQSNEWNSECMSIYMLMMFKCMLVVP